MSTTCFMQATGINTSLKPEYICFPGKHFFKSLFNITYDCATNMGLLAFSSEDAIRRKEI